MSELARYRLHQKRFIGGHLYNPDGPEYKNGLPEIEVPGDFPAGMGMEPLNDAAKRAVKAYEEKIGAKPVPEPVVVREITQRPPMEPVPTRPLGDDFKTPHIPLPAVNEKVK